MDRTSTTAASHPPPRIYADPSRLALGERDGAWKLAAHLIASARAGRPSVALYEGTAGLGKSGLVAAIGSLAAESGVRVFSASGRSRETQFGFGIVLQLLDSGSTGAGEDTAGPWVPRLAGADASLGAVYPLYRFFRTSAAASPTAVIVDDLDLADEPSLRFLLYLIDRMAAVPLAVIACVGNVPARRAPSVLMDIVRHPLTTRFPLEPLTEIGTARRLGKTWLPGTVDAFAPEVHRATNGNPFLVDLLAAAVAARNGDATPVQELAPPAVAEWARARAAYIDSRAPALLDAIAIFGGEVELRHAAALAEVDTETAGELADALSDAGLLSGGDRVSFRHPVVARAVEAALPSATRGLRHLRAARQLSEEAAGAERVSQHLLQSIRTGSDWAVDALRAAAAAALRAGAPWDAVVYLRRALQEPPTRGDRAQVMLDLGRAEAMAGEPEAAVRLRQAAELLSQAVEQPVAALTSGRTLFALGRPEQALGVFERGLANTNGADPTVVGQLRAGQAIATWLTTFPDADSRKLLEPPARGDTPGDRALLALHAIDAALRGEPCVDVRMLAVRALGGGALLADETADALAYYLAVAALGLAEDFETTESALTAAVEDARSRGSVLGLATASQWRATTMLLRGRLGDAAVEAGRALVFADYGWRFGLSKARVVLAATLLERGDLEGAGRELDSAEEASVARDPFRLSLLDTRGRVRLAQGDAVGALQDFRACGALAKKASVTNPAVVGWRSHAGLALSAMGDSKEAVRLADEELKLAEAFGAPGPVGHALRALAAIREPALAVETLQAAVEVLEHSQAELEFAGALVDLGAALRRSGRRGAARDPLLEGLQLAGRCGADALATRARREMRLSGARPRRAALHGTDSLTEREREVAQLAVQGLSNRRIAETLVVTLKTVEWHLHHSYRKLGVHSRRELRELLGRGGATRTVG